ncbi:MAG: fused MFS/spermidine synthase [Deltaproteobacteria bacterium]|nr:fused MFS/spermidine synthase [Deltaproteobacteria bacterium]
MNPNPSPLAARSTINPLIFVFFFLSGGSGLVYELVWSKTLSLIFGSTTFAMATVLSSFMGGLAAGSYVAGKRIDARPDALRVYGLLEVGIGVYAVLFPLLLSLLSPFYIWLYGALELHFYLLSLVKFCVSFILVLIPTFLMGATLPVLSRYLVIRQDDIGVSVGALYTVNTCGAVVGCFLTGFILLRFWGIHLTTYAAALVNVAIGIWAIQRQRRVAARPVIPSPPAPQPKLTGKSGKKKRTAAFPVGPKAQPISAPAISSNLRWFLIFLAFYGGFSSLAYQVFLTRVYLMFLGSFTYTLTIILGAFLLGILLGGLVFTRYLSRPGPWDGLWLGAAKIVAGLNLLVLLLCSGRMVDIKDSLRAWLGVGPVMTYVNEFLLVFIFIFVSTFAMGLLLPLAIKLYTDRVDLVGARVGQVYGANSLGSCLGPFLAGFLIIPWLGIMKSIFIFSLVDVALGMCCLAVFPAAGKRLRVALPVAAGIAVIIMTLVAGRSLAPLKPYTLTDKNEELLFYDENFNSISSIYRNQRGVKTLYDNARHILNMEETDTFVTMAHLPMLMAARTDQVLVIGFGSGITAGKVARYQPKAITAIEISSGIMRGAKVFAEENEGILNNPILTPIIDDGRNYLLLTGRTFDAITLDPSHFYLNGSSQLYTEEFYRLVYAGLNDGGVFCQWFPLRANEFDLISAMKAFHLVFQETSLWQTKDGGFFLLGRRGGKFDYQTMLARYALPAVKADLAANGYQRLEEVLGCFVLGPRGIEQLLAGAAEVNRDDLPYNEYPSLQFDIKPLIMRMLSLAESPWSYFSPPPQPGPGDLRDAVSREQAATRHVLYSYVVKDPAIEISEALRLSPKNESIRKIVGLDKKGQARLVDELVRRRTGTFSDYLDLARVNWWDGQPQMAQDMLRQGLALYPNNLDGLVKLGLWAMEAGDDRTVQEAVESIRTRPGHDQTAAGVADVLGRLAGINRRMAAGNDTGRVRLQAGDCYYQLGLYYQAAALYRPALQAESDSMEARLGLARCYEKLEDYDQALEVLKPVASSREGAELAGRLSALRQVPCKIVSFY